MKHTLHLTLAAALLACTALPAAAQQGGQPQGAPAAKSASAAEMADGEIRRIDKARGTVLLKHGEIRSINMGPMTMSFRLQDPKMAEGLAAGDKVRFAVVDRAGDLVITRIEKAR